MKIFYMVLILHVTLFATGRTLYIAPYGDDKSDATLQSPLKTLQKALTMVDNGDTIYLREGSYPLGIYINQKATKKAPIMISAYQNEHVLFKGDRSCKNNDFRIRGDWIIVQNIEIENSCNGLLLEKGASHNLIKHVVSHGNHFSGFMITRGAAYNTLINCDAYDNFDKGGSMGDGGNADGFGTGSRIGNNQYIGRGNRLVHCRAWHNSDDGFDFWKSGNPVMLIKCQAYNNGYAKGDGNGFKLGPNNPLHSNDHHVVLSSKAWDNKQNGFDYNDNKDSLILVDNSAYNNLVNYKFYGQAEDIMIENRSIQSKRANKLSPHIIDIKNIWHAKEKFVADDNPINPTILVIGDSTVANYSHEDKKGGWGEMLGYFLPYSKVVNFAKSGKSSKTFYQDGIWDKTAQLLKRNMILLIQFGHNDSHVGEREGTSTKEYLSYIEFYIQEAKKRGAYPILVTPMHRIKFDRDGKLREDLKKYERAMLTLSKKNNIACINLYAYSEDLFEALGTRALPLFLADMKDKTHFSKTGAAILAGYVAREILDMY